MSLVSGAFLMVKESPAAIVVAASVEPIAVPVEVTVSRAGGMMETPLQRRGALHSRLKFAELEGDHVRARLVLRRAAGAFRRILQRLELVEIRLSVFRPTRLRRGRLDAGPVAGDADFGDAGLVVGPARGGDAFAVGLPLDRALGAVDPGLFRAAGAGFPGRPGVRGAGLVVPGRVTRAGGPFPRKCPGVFDLLGHTEFSTGDC